MNKKNRYRRLICCIVLALALLLAGIYAFHPQPILKKGASVSDTVYFVFVNYSPASHENEVYLYDGDTDFQSDVPASHYAMNREVEEQLEELLQRFQMRRTLRYTLQMDRYNIDRFAFGVGEDSLHIHSGKEKTLIQRGYSWYRVTEPNAFFFRTQQYNRSICRRMCI